MSLRGPPLTPIPSHINSVRTSPSYFLKIKSQIILPSTSCSSKWSFLLQVSLLNLCTNFSSLPCMPHAPSIPSYCKRLPKNISSRKRKNIPIPCFGAASFKPFLINALSKLHHFLIFALILGLNALWLVDVYNAKPLISKGNVIFHLHRFYLRPVFQDRHCIGVQQVLGAAEGTLSSSNNHRPL